MTSSIEYGTGKFSTRDGRSAVRRIVTLAWDGTDPKGSSLSPLFDACETLHAFGEHVPDECGYRPSPMLDSPEDLADEWPAAEFVELMNENTVSAEDLQYWARVLDRYLDLFVRGTDHDY